ncbi:hypothetical protein PG993_001905 [Apiospora rasikravindrae]|uniref:PWWP domain-containing protein n=1 Tax=Apiospora rasikravindrae TaxID=990691 RepID=A0ABR1UCQ3_9PEZI
MADTEKSVAAQQLDKVETASESAAPAVDDVKMDDAPSASNEEAAEKTAASEAAAANDKANSDVDMNEAESAKEAPEGEKTESGASATNDDSTKPADESAEKKEDSVKDKEQKAEAVISEAAESAAEGAAIEANGATPSSSKQAARRKSTGTPAAKKLNKKASKARMLHLDCVPGDHFFARLKGFPPWPVIIADESMLPQTMLSTRPVTAARPDGSYREDFADGGKRAGDRTYPVMYLHTNEFSWTRNTDLAELDPETVKDLISTKMRKDLQQAHILAAEQNELEHYKQLLLDFQEAKLAEEEAKAAKAQAKKEKTEKKTNKKSEATAVDEDDDVEMADAGEDDEVPVKKPKSSKKRKAEEETARSDSVKKPKIKLTTSSTPKAAANGAQSPKNGKESTTKASKPKSKAAKKDAEEKPAAPKEPELTPRSAMCAKRYVAQSFYPLIVKEILFLRHRLQKGLLNRESEPKEDEMKSMSEFLTKLETFPDLEVSIIRATKINKVLKAILKLEGIPKEADFQFKPRSKSLLDKWTEILANDTGAAPAAGVNGTSAKESANGVKKEASAEAPKEEAKEDGKDSDKEAETKAGADAEDKPSTEEATAVTEAAAVEPVA